jgi:predicted metal-dependent enzyme (double-stranded beta helix superfamily)
MSNLSNYSLKEFTSDTELAVRRRSSESEILRKVKPLVERLVRSGNQVPPMAFRPRQDKYAMNLVYMPKDESFSVIGAVWQPGQTTPIHDHLTWVVIGTYEGEERETLYRRTDDGYNPSFAKLEKVKERVNQKGDVTVLGEAGIHRVDNISDKPLWSIHVYGRDIGGTERHTYDPITGKVSAFRSGYCNVLRDLDQF